MHTHPHVRPYKQTRVGLFFQFIMCCSILFSGIVLWIIQCRTTDDSLRPGVKVCPTFQPLAMLGGVIWCLGESMRSVCVCSYNTVRFDEDKIYRIYDPITAKIMLCMSTSVCVCVHSFLYILDSLLQYYHFQSPFGSHESCNNTQATSSL